jgi:hypothetical protein
MALMCFLFPVFGLTARGAASGPTVRLKPTSLGGEGNEIERRDNGADATGFALHRRRQERRGRIMLVRGDSMGWLSDILNISLERANQFYTYGWRLSAIGAATTVLGVGLLWWGTRVRDHDFESHIARLGSTTADTLERAGKLEVAAENLRQNNLQLQRDLERERVERLRLEERVKPRGIPPDKRDDLIALLKTSLKGTVFVVPKMFDEEAGEFAKQIISVLKDAGFDVPEWIGKGALDGESRVHFYFSRTWTRHLRTPLECSKPSSTAVE